MDPRCQGRLWRRAEEGEEYNFGGTGTGFGPALSTSQAGDLGRGQYLFSPYFFICRTWGNNTTCLWVAVGIKSDNCCKGFSAVPGAQYVLDKCPLL